MKLIKLVLRIWIGVSSVVGFLVGWMLLAHSGKPAPVNAESAQSAQNTVSATIAMPTLQPIPSLDDLTKGAQIQPVQSLTVIPRVSNLAPRIRTGGS